MTGCLKDAFASTSISSFSSFLLFFRFFRYAYVSSSELYNRSPEPYRFTFSRSLFRSAFTASGSFTGVFLACFVLLGA